MCYGGSFAARRSEIIKWPHEVWRVLATRLTRGDSIAEAHFMERLWGLLLTPSMREDILEALLCATLRVVSSGGYSGMLVGCSCRQPVCSKYHRLYFPHAGNVRFDAQVIHSLRK